VTFDHSRFRWISNAGRWRPGSFVVLPAGEIATYPASVTGRLVADFAIHTNVPMEIDTRLHDTPVTLDLEEGRVVRVSCAYPALYALLREWFAEPHVDRCGEVGFGTNLGVTASVEENSHVNERSPGLHLGFGNHHQSTAAVGYSCDIHLDFIAAGGIVMVPGGPAIDLRGLIPPAGPTAETGETAQIGESAQAAVQVEIEDVR
jgi:leucyl aminopeptidase (aminopeptidase T)